MQSSTNTRTYYRHQKPHEVGPRACLLLVGFFFCIPGIVLLATNLSNTAGIVLLCVAGTFLLLSFILYGINCQKQKQTQRPNTGVVTVATTSVQQQQQQPYIVQQSRTNQQQTNVHPTTTVFQAYGLPQVSLSYNQQGVMTANMGQMPQCNVQPNDPTQVPTPAPPSYEDVAQNDKGFGEV